MKQVANININLFEDYMKDLYDMKHYLSEIINYSTISLYDLYPNTTKMAIEICYLCDNAGERYTKVKEFAVTPMNTIENVSEQIIQFGETLNHVHMISDIGITMYEA